MYVCDTDKQEEINMKKFQEDLAKIEIARNNNIYRPDHVPDLEVELPNTHIEANPEL